MAHTSEYKANTVWRTVKNLFVPKKKYLIKTLAYQVFSFCALIMITFIMTGSIELSSLVAGINFFHQCITYYTFEEAWDEWGWDREW